MTISDDVVEGRMIHTQNLTQPHLVILRILLGPGLGVSSFGSENLLVNLLVRKPCAHSVAKLIVASYRENSP